MEFGSDVNDIEIPQYTPSELYTKAIAKYPQKKQITMPYIGPMLTSWCLNLKSAIQLEYLRIELNKRM